MRKRWTAAGMRVAERQFRRIIGYHNLAKLVIAIERDADRVKLATASTVTHTQMSKPLLSDCQSHVETAAEVSRPSGHPPLKSPRALHDRARRSRADRAATESASPPPPPGGPRSGKTTTPCG